MKKLLVVLLMILSIGSSVFGFATVVSGLKGGDPITFSTNVTDVEVFLNGTQITVMKDTSFLYSVKRSKADQIFEFKKSGYKTVEIKLTKSADPLFWGNVLSGGTYGSSTDSWTTGASKQYSPNQYYVSMTRI
ncbi:hypothetical protein DID80_04985 [Candidatus Marinamargulisbacteria bacterium SCGC AAA071-K20]|nr:hypothetical protein DID80_04985 [Candidatus Marinamargulisbacteria bacterium SCGC AAA071-K20]